MECRETAVDKGIHISGPAIYERGVIMGTKEIRFVYEDDWSVCYADLLTADAEGGYLIQDSCVSLLEAVQKFEAYVKRLNRYGIPLDVAEFRVRELRPFVEKLMCRLEKGEKVEYVQESTGGAGIKKRYILEQPYMDKKKVDMSVAMFRKGRIFHVPDDKADWKRYLENFMVCPAVVEICERDNIHELVSVQVYYEYGLLRSFSKAEMQEIMRRIYMTGFTGEDGQDTDQ